MNLYQGYCYSTITEASDAEISQPVIPGQTGASVAVSFVASGSDNGVMTFNSSSFTSYTLTRVYPSCSSVGYQHNLTGLTLSDVNESSWMVFGVFAAVWAIKYLRRAL